MTDLSGALDGVRPLRVLHLGNIANNGYLNAKFLNAAGHDCDVLSYGHYHLMSSPEWEDGDFERGPADQNRPDWSQVDLGGFRRPDWFSEGPFPAAAAYLLARRRSPATARWRRRWLDARRQLIVGSEWAAVREWRRRWRTARPAPEAHSSAPEAAAAAGPTSQPQLARRFAEVFPERTDRLTAGDIAGYGTAHGWSTKLLRQLFAQYDVVHAYGAEPVLPLLAGHHPFVAFEHGTIRALPFADSPAGRLVALAYHEADAVIITNADNRAAADRLGITRARFVPHPINEYRPDSASVARLRHQLRERLNADFVIFHPSRQHWNARRDPMMEKGNDRFIDGFAAVVAAHPRAAAVFVKWGESEPASRARLRELGIDGRVEWIDPVPTPALSRYMAACDVVADQFHLGAFGGITPRAMMLGVPPLLYLDAAAHHWCFPEQPPVLNAREPGEISAVLARAIGDRAWLAARGEACSRWYLTYHSRPVVLNGLLEAYRTALARQGIGA